MTCECGENRFGLLGWDGPDLVLKCKTCGREFVARNCVLESICSDPEVAMNEDGTVAVVMGYEEVEDEADNHGGRRREGGVRVPPG